MINILIAGSKGQLGSEIKEIAFKYPDYNFLYSDSGDMDITNHKAVDEFIKVKNIKAIINCAAYTAVEKAESEPALANSINHLAVANFAKIAKEKKIIFIHISTDYVFDGTNSEPYLETDIPNPQSVYGRSKLDGELAIKKINPANSIIIRTSWLYSRFGNNFYKTMLNLSQTREQISVVVDQIGSPTNAADLAKAILTILPKISNKKVELFHYSNEGMCSWYNFANTIFKILNKKINIKPIRSNEFPSLVKRPMYSVLDKTLIKDKFGLTIKNWEKSFVNSFKNI